MNEIIVVGGGLAGASTTYHLTKLGYKVVLFEMGNIASGASGRNGGQVLQCEGKDSDPYVIMDRLKYTKKHVELLHQYEEELDFDIEFNQIGSLDMVANDEEFEEIKALYAIQTKAGDNEVEFLDWKGLHKLNPYFADFLQGARFRWTDGNINSLFLVNGLVDMSIKQGARVYTWNKVESVIIESGKVKGIKTKDKNYPCDIVVLATSFWTRELLPDFGLRIFPHRPVCCISEPYPEVNGPAFEVKMGDDITWGATQFKGGHLLTGGGAGRPRKLEE
ncbi:MAG: FAD-binding oxidoreductase [Spirochaetota bacterium]|nr:MAG: FAD-binding oxidoreductase [Spirochaetota bacterium]